MAAKEAGLSKIEAAQPPRLAVRNISKRFQSVQANDRIGFEVAPGQIHALLGENGAGKSTIVKIVYGILQPDEGEILWDGRLVRIDSPRTARALGIGMVFQHFSLFEAMTVAENIALGLNQPGGMKALSRRIAELSAAYGLALDPGRDIHTLSVGERQRVEIVRCLLQDPRLLIMDEPTSVLTPQETRQLFETLRRLAAEGCSILYISHKLYELQELCQRATILRGGRVVGSCDPAQESAQSMAQLMIGGVPATASRQRNETAGAPRLVVSGLDLPADQPFGVALKDVGFTLAAGEILGIAGVSGNGQDELMAALSGERLLPEAGRIQFDGQPVGKLDFEQRRALGLYAVPEKRDGCTAVPGMSLAANTLLSARGGMALSNHGVLRKSRAKAFARRIIDAYGVKADGPQAAAGTLSGGNLQKFVVGRDILQNPKALVIAQPTWGVDAGAAAAIHQALFDLARRGAGIVVISQDLDELLALSDRLMVIHLGRLSPPMPAGEVSAEAIGLLMGGAAGVEGQTHAA